MDELLAGLLARERREKELFAALLDGMQSEDISDDEDQLEEMTIKAEILTRLCKVEERLCALEAKVDEVAAAE